MIDPPLAAFGSSTLRLASIWTPGRPHRIDPGFVVPRTHVYVACLVFHTHTIGRGQRRRRKKRGGTGSKCDGPSRTTKVVAHVCSCCHHPDAMRFPETNL